MTTPPPTPPLDAFSHTDATTWVEHYLDAQRILLAAETIATYHQKLQQFLDWWREHAPEAPYTARLAYQYARHIEQQPWSSRTHLLHFAVLRRWSGYLITIGRLSENPWQQIRSPRQPAQLSTDWLTFGEIKKLLQSFTKQTLSHQRDALLCRLMLKTGVREAELGHALIGDVQPIGPDEQEAWLVVKSKGKQKIEPVLLVRSLYDDLKAYLRRRYPQGPFPAADPLFTTYYDEEARPMPPREMRRRITAAYQRAGIHRSGITPLSLRQTAGKQALAKRAPLSAVQAMMRHENIKTTKRLVEQEHRQQNAAERFLSHY
jgi:site-specific recombinase XerD